MYVFLTLRPFLRAQAWSLCCPIHMWLASQIQSETRGLTANSRSTHCSIAVKRFRITLRFFVPSLADMSAPPFCALVLFALGVRGDTSDGLCEHTSLLQSSASRGQGRAFEDLCFKQVQRLMPYDSLLSPRIATKNELFMAAMASGKPMEDIVKDIVNELSAKNGHPADGTMSACGPTGSWLAELYIGLIGEITLGNPSDWEVYGSQKLWDAFTKERNAGKHMFWYMMTSGSHQSHIWSIEQLPKTEDQPVRYLWCILPRDVRTEQLFANQFWFSELNHYKLKTFSRGAASKRGIAP